MINKNYYELTKEELIERLKQADTLIEQIQKAADKEELTNFPWVGNLGQWNWSIPSDELIFNEKKATNLGYSKEEIPEDIGFEFFTSKLHPDDYEKVMDNMRQHLKGRIESYEIEYRILKKDGNYAWYYDRGTVIKRDENGKALIVSGIVFDISYEKEIKEKLFEAKKRYQHLARIDDLTSVYNKRYMSRKIIKEMASLDENKNSLSLIMLDIDDFKEINDQYGHQAGDYFLKYLAQKIKENIQRDDVISRWGGDEFLILFKNKSIHEVNKIAEKIRSSFEKMKDEQLIQATTSIGVAEFKEKAPLEEAIIRVDKLMYEAKFSGKNQIIS